MDFFPTTFALHHFDSFSLIRARGCCIRSTSLPLPSLMSERRTLHVGCSLRISLACFSQYHTKRNASCLGNSSSLMAVSGHSEPQQFAQPISACLKPTPVFILVSSSSKPGLYFG